MTTIEQTPEERAAARTAELSESSLQRQRRGRIVAAAAILFAAAGLVKGIMLLLANDPATVGYSYGQIALGVMGVVGGLFLLRFPYRNGIGWGILTLWALLMIPVMTTNPDNVACNDQIFNLTGGVTDTLPIGSKNELYAYTGLNLMGLVWVTLINTVVVKPPIKRAELTHDVILPGPSK